MYRNNQKLLQTVRHWSNYVQFMMSMVTVDYHKIVPITGIEFRVLTSLHIVRWMMYQEIRHYIRLYSKPKVAKDLELETSHSCNLYRHSSQLGQLYEMKSKAAFHIMSHLSKMSNSIFLHHLLKTSKCGLGSESPRTHLSTCDDLDLTHLNVRRS